MIDREKIVWMLIAFFVGITVGVAGLTLTKRTQPVPIVITAPEPTPLPLPTATPGPMRVYVSGAVTAPDVYELLPGSIVQDAITLAGGFTTQANTAVVNLAYTLRDGDQVYVPAQDETVAAPALLVNSVAETAAAAGDAPVGGLIDINTATIEELDALPGIGPSTAEKIIAYRETNGAFASVEGIMDVAGIGDAKFAQIKDFITVGSQ